MANTKNFENKTAEEKSAYVRSKTAYWPSSMVDRFSELEIQNHKMFQVLLKIADNQKIDLAGIMQDDEIEVK
jgi:hypothetical protein